LTSSGSPHASGRHRPPAPAASAACPNPAKRPTMHWFSCLPSYWPSDCYLIY